MLLRDPGEQLRTRDKKVASVSRQREHDDARRQRRKHRQRRERMRWFRRELSRAETAVRVVLLLLPIGALAAVFVHAAGLPDTWTAEHERVVSSSPARVFATLQDLSTWPRWAKVAPLAKGDARYPVGSRGKHAVIEVSRGGSLVVRLMIYDLEAGARLTYLVFPADSDTAVRGEITLRPTGSGTAVRWKESGSYPDEPLGVLQRLGAEERREESLAAIGRSLEGLGRAAAAARTGTSAGPAGH